MSYAVENSQTEINRNDGRGWILPFVIITGMVLGGLGIGPLLDSLRKNQRSDISVSLATPISGDINHLDVGQVSPDLATVVAPVLYEDIDVVHSVQVPVSSDFTQAEISNIQYHVEVVPEPIDPLSFIREKGITPDFLPDNQIKYEITDNAGYIYHLIFSDDTIGVFEAVDDSGTDNYDGFMMQAGFTPGGSINFNMLTVDVLSNERHWGMNAGPFAATSIDYFRNKGVTVDEVVFYWTKDFGLKGKETTSLGYTQMMKQIQSGILPVDAIKGTRAYEVFSGLGFNEVGEILIRDAYIEAYLYMSK